MHPFLWFQVSAKTVCQGFPIIGLRMEQLGLTVEMGSDKMQNGSRGNSRSGITLPRSPAELATVLDVEPL